VIKPVLNLAVFLGYKDLQRARFWGLVTGRISFLTIVITSGAVAGSGACSRVLIILACVEIELGMDFSRQIGRRGSCIHVHGFVPLPLLLLAKVLSCLPEISGENVHSSERPCFVDQAGALSVGGMPAVYDRDRSDGEAYLCSLF
jgi:hypothetical protein